MVWWREGHDGKMINTKRKLKWWGIAVIVVIALGSAVWGTMVSAVEQPKYKVVESSGSIEIRDYAPMIIAETEVSGDRKEAIGKGFRIIANYIFGDNKAAQKVAMTAPVTQQSSEKIAMTAPVAQQGEGNSWKVHFVMPSSYTMETLPKPNSRAVKLKQIGGKRFAVIQFSGTGGQSSLERHTAELRKFLSTKGLRPLSAPTYAFYNPPWTLPFMRRNEVMLEVSQDGGRE